MKEFELEPGEQVVRETRKHWFFFLAELLPYGILAVFPFALPRLLTLLPQLASFGGKINYALPFPRILFSLWLLIVWTGAWSTFTRYFLNAWILTTERIVEIKQRAYFNREVSSLLLHRVQDVTSDVTGILPSLLDIGKIKVQSAGAEVEFSMRNIPRPEEMRDLILKYVPDEPKNSAV